MKGLLLSPDLKLPAEAVTQTFAILAMRGVGKTHTASVFAEELSKARLAYRVIDPTGAWWGLRASADGKGEGYPVTILGGDHGDIPLEEHAGKLIAGISAEDAPAIVLDLSLLSKSATRRFVADFAEELYRRNRLPLQLIIDEADAVAPQKPRSDELRMLGAIDDIVRRGRIRGLGCTLVTQRSAVLNKDVLTQAEVLIALRTAHPRDRAPVLEWMKVHATEEQLRAVEESLAKLPKGDAWVMSAGWLDLFRRVHIRERETFNSSATPEPGQRRIEPRKLAPVDLAALQERMKETIERAKAEDPRLLRARIATLEKQITHDSKLLARREEHQGPVAAPREKRVEVPVLGERDLKRIDKAAEVLANASGLVAALLVDVKEQLARARVPPPAPLPGHRVGTGYAVPAATRRAPGAETLQPARSHPAPVNGAPELRRGERRMLEVLARGLPAKRTRAQLGTLSGFTPSGGTYGTYFGVLKRHGLVREEPDGSVSITEAGLEAVGGAAPAPQTTEEVLETWRRALRSGEREMLDALVAVYPRSMSRDELGERTGFTASGGTFGTYLGVLRRNGLAEITGDGVRAGEALFLNAGHAPPEGTP